jgi:hypothetical protein
VLEVRSGRARELAADLENKVTALRDREEAALAAHTAEEERRIRTNMWMFVAVTAADVLLLGLGYWGMQRYVADRKRTEATLAAARKHAEAANMAKDRVLDTVSHDLRTPLNGVMLWDLSRAIAGSGTLAHQFKKIDELRQLVLGDVGELDAVKILHRFIEFLEDPQSLGGDARGDDAPVAGIALPGDHGAGFEAVEEPGDIRIAGDHVFADGFAGDSAAAGATAAGGDGITRFALEHGFFAAMSAQDAQDVVLGCREIVRFEEIFKGPHEVIGSANHIQEDFLLQAVEGLGLVDLLKQFSGHAHRVDVATNECKRGIGEQE